MNDLLNCGMKIPAMQAWRWFICFLGPFAMKHKHLLNEMLKFTELTFSDFDPQVQIAALVLISWFFLPIILELKKICQSQFD